MVTMEVGSVKAECEAMKCVLFYGLIEHPVVVAVQLIGLTVNGMLLL
jgi:hypothetical protein